MEIDKTKGITSCNSSENRNATSKKIALGGTLPLAAFSRKWTRRSPTSIATVIDKAIRNMRRTLAFIYLKPVDIYLRFRAYSLWNI